MSLRVQHDTRSNPPKKLPMPVWPDALGCKLPPNGAKDSKILVDWNTKDSCVFNSTCHFLEQATAIRAHVAVRARSHNVRRGRKHTQLEFLSCAHTTRIVRSARIRWTEGALTVGVDSPQMFSLSISKF
ncbi:hypothetical protein TNCT_32111 [Trichonephila clavata]|uniref:Uncharacterized protein n=1 Tax=Trichonephila clavata TaxID=2740835 RepID=A0A8X6JGY5_TRICU|nr:hypothetical protein TNCT_32111 [Trichonephila clavata]